MIKKQKHEFCFFLPVISEHKNKPPLDLTIDCFHKLRGPFPMQEFEGIDIVETLDSIYFGFISKNYPTVTTQNTFIIICDYSRLFPVQQFIVRSVKSIKTDKEKNSLTIRSKQNKEITYVRPMTYRHPFVNKIIRKVIT